MGDPDMHRALLLTVNGIAAVVNAAAVALELPVVIGTTV